MRKIEHTADAIIAATRIAKIQGTIELVKVIDGANGNAGSWVAVRVEYVHESGDRFANLYMYMDLEAAGGTKDTNLYAKYRKAGGRWARVHNGYV